MKLPGTVAHDTGLTNGQPTEMIVIEHPSGVIEVQLKTATSDGAFTLKKAGTVRTVRKLMDGNVYH